MDHNKRAQEEMIGFALIVILVAVILIIFLGFSLNKPKPILESYKAQSFMRVSLQYTTECEDNFGYLSVQDLIYTCDRGISCLRGENPCVLLNSTLRDIIEKGWNVGTGSSIKGYEINVFSDTGVITSISKGNITSSSEGASQDIPRGGTLYNVTLSIYY